MAAGRVYSGPLFLAFAAAGGGEVTRVGVTASRRVGGAVARNLARRRLRELARLRILTALPPTGRAWDVILVARPGMVSATAPDICSEADRLVSRLGKLVP